jgi:hypothetical protein
VSVFVDFGLKNGRLEKKKKRMCNEQTPKETHEERKRESSWATPNTPLSPAAPLLLSSAPSPFKDHPTTTISSYAHVAREKRSCQHHTKHATAVPGKDNLKKGAVYKKQQQ